MFVLLLIFCFVLALFAVGFFYQRIGSLRDRSHYASLGRWIDIGQGRRLYLLEKGSGAPAVLFEAGIAATNP